MVLEFFYLNLILVSLKKNTLNVLEKELRSQGEF